MSNSETSGSPPLPPRLPMRGSAVNMCARYGPVGLPQMCVNDFAVRDQIAKTSEELREKLYNNRKKTHTLANDKNPKLYFHRGVEQVARNVMVSVPQHALKYKTWTRINIDDPKEPIGNSVSEYLLFLFESGNYSDVLFNLVEFGVKIPAHSQLLVARSEQFRKMFVENKSPGTCEVRIDGTTVEMFQLFLKCFYSDEIEIDESVSIEILRLAYRFDVRSLIARCATSMQGNININSVWCIFNIACECDQSDLKYWCLEFISRNTREALRDENFPKMALDKVLVVVSHDALNVPEIEIFQAILKWAEIYAAGLKLRPQAAKQRRQLIRTLLPHVRFPLMTTEQLKSIVQPARVLDDNDLADILTYVDNKEKGKDNTKVHLPYETNPRGAKYIALLYDHHEFRDPATFLSTNGEKDVFYEEFRFESDTDMYLGGICFYGSGLQDKVKSHLLYVEYDIIFRIMGENRQQNFFTTTELKKCANRDFEALLPSHYPISKGCMYTASVEISGYRKRFGARKVTEKVMKLSGGRFATIKFFEREDGTVFCHNGICRGLVFTLNSRYV